ncbi:hypothetical protein [Streptomyces sp. SID13031]|uniref:hypothetical protein n=1 Tax=Streptomyces sp. SID13031 TaxID=2706046 RepID=UPI0013CB68F5|nr:hypothetical protein [Streptomyces sp. SID13031]NEA33763.1 hypothetical protein [Streptomyces sp. SID13031]
MLFWRLENSGRRQEAHELGRAAAAGGYIELLFQLMLRHEEAGNAAAVDRLIREITDYGFARTLLDHAQSPAGDKAGGPQIETILRALADE